MKKLGIIIGSLRKESYNRKIAEYMVNQLDSDFEVEILEIGKLALYNEDLDDNPPSEWTDFRKKVKEKDAYLFVSPEYNRSMPAVLKNALDVASRPMQENVWNDKPGAVITASPGAIGGFGSNHHLRQTMTFLNLHIMAQPEAYLGGIDQALDEDGNLTNERTLAFLQKIALEFKKWTDKFQKAVLLLFILFIYSQKNIKFPNLYI